MNADERAEKIYQALLKPEASLYFSDPTFSIAEQIKEAEQDARNEALEEAAKVAEKGPGPGGVIYCNGDVRDPGVVVTAFQKWIADAIRALKEKK